MTADGPTRADAAVVMAGFIAKAFAAHEKEAHGTDSLSDVPDSCLIDVADRLNVLLDEVSGQEGYPDGPAH